MGWQKPYSVQHSASLPLSGPGQPPAWSISRGSALGGGGVSGGGGLAGDNPGLLPELGSRKARDSIHDMDHSSSVMKGIVVTDQKVTTVVLINSCTKSLSIAD